MVSRRCYGSMAPKRYRENCRKVQSDHGDKSRELLEFIAGSEALRRDPRIASHENANVFPYAPPAADLAIGDD
jgi:hypothetical protein